MAHHNSILSQVLKLVPRHEFGVLSKSHHQGQKLRKISRWDQFVSMLVGQLAGRQSLRDIETNMNTQSHYHYHLGCHSIARSSLARVNAEQPYTLYKALFEKLSKRCQGHTPRHKFRFKNPLYSLDSSLIDLSLKIFPWAEHNRTKAAMKLPVGLDHSGHIPVFAHITDGKAHDVPTGREFNFPAGSIVVKDKGYTDYGWYKSLTEKGVFFVTRQRTNALYQVINRSVVNKASGVTSDQLIRLTGAKARQADIPVLRRVGYRDEKTGKHYVFLTNHFKLSAKTIADVYKDRWQVELFFKAIKQNLHIKAFVGNSRNAVLTQIWIALCAYLMVSYLKFIAKSGWSTQRIIRVLQINLFARRDLMALITCVGIPKIDPPPQLGLWA